MFELKDLMTLDNEHGLNVGEYVTCINGVGGECGRYYVLTNWTQWGGCHQKWWVKGIVEGASDGDAKDPDLTAEEVDHDDLQSLHEIDLEYPLRTGDYVTLIEPCFKNGVYFRVGEPSFGPELWKTWEWAHKKRWVRGLVEDAEHGNIAGIKKVPLCVSPAVAVEPVDPEYSPVLYIIMRTDIPQMNPGKACAQAAHAQSMISSVYDDEDSPSFGAYAKWKDQAEGFGTTIVLEASKEEFDDARRDAPSFVEYVEVVDPTYPMTNWRGEFFTRQETTCWAIFAHSQEVRDYIKTTGLPLAQ